MVGKGHGFEEEWKAGKYEDTLGNFSKVFR